MTDRPILFSASMVRALLAGTKTQTRRIVKPQPAPEAGSAGVITSHDPDSHGLWYWLDGTDMDCCPMGPQFRCPYGVPGDVLWVKETFRLPAEYDHLKPTMVRDGVPVWYEADGRAPEGWGKVRVSLHMQRRFSRLALTITDVRVQRLNECSEADALAEGVEMETADPPFYYVPGIWPHSLTAVGVEQPGGDHAVRSYAKLWDHINGPGAWASNPWVWAVSFEVDRI